MWDGIQYVNSFREVCHVKPPYFCKIYVTQLCAVLSSTMVFKGKFRKHVRKSIIEYPQELRDVCRKIDKYAAKKQICRMECKKLNPGRPDLLKRRTKLKKNNNKERKNIPEKDQEKGKANALSLPSSPVFARGLKCNICNGNFLSIIFYTCTVGYNVPGFARFSLFPNKISEQYFSYI